MVKCVVVALLFYVKIEELKFKVLSIKGIEHILFIKNEKRANVKAKRIRKESESIT